MSDQNLIKDLKKTYLSMIRNSLDSRMFNSVWVKRKDTGESIDVLKDGDLSCAFFVSSILTLFNMLDKPCTTIKKVFEKISKDKRWSKKSYIEPGDIILWEKVKFKDGTENKHKHIGFALNKKTAVSTNYLEKKIAKHSIDFDGKRKIEGIWRYSFDSKKK